MNSLEELKSHLDIEFSNVENKKVDEVRSVVSGVEKAVDVIMASAKTVVDRAFSKANLLRRSKRSFTFDMSGIDVFFDKCFVNVTVVRGNNIDPKYNGGFFPRKSLSEKDGRLHVTPFINVKVKASSKWQAIHILKGTLGHELTHAYNSYQYGVKNNKSTEEIISNAFDDQHYRDIESARTSKEDTSSNKQAVGFLNYVLNRMERNAIIAQLAQELESASEYIVDSKTAMEAIRTTESWQKYHWVENNVNIILSSGNDAHIVKTVTDVTNQIMGTKFTDYEQVKKYYTNRWNIWKKKYLTAASKIAYDIYERTHGKRGADNQRQS